MLGGRTGTGDGNGSGCSVVTYVRYSVSAAQLVSCVCAAPSNVPHPPMCPPSHMPRPPCMQEAVALVSKLQYNSLFDPAVKRVFGKTLVCRTLEAASQLAKSDELDCVTLDGERRCGR